MHHNDFQNNQDFSNKEVDEYTCVSGCTMEVEYYSEIHREVQRREEQLSFFLKNDVVKIHTGPPGGGKK